MSHRSLISLGDNLAKNVGMLILPGEREHKLSPELGKPAEPVQCLRWNHAGVDQRRSGSMQPVVATFHVLESVWLIQWAVPWMPGRAVCKFDVDVYSNLAQVMDERTVGRCCRPCFGLGSLRLRWGSNGQQVHLPDLQCVGDDLKTVIQHAAVVGMVVVLRGREMLHQSCVALERLHVKRIELFSGERGALPDVFNELAPPRSRKQRIGRLEFEKACSSIGRYRRRFSSRKKTKH
ncbi:hypothetical protein BV326_05420 [Pseudomonas syringae pv. actinidiae]|nr:hypothetical protein BV326_05420 [Pseudomonas syringae pv. actinidiae]